MMKTILICPDQRESVAALAEIAPLANLSILGKPLIEHWLDCVSMAGAKDVIILAADRPAQVRAFVGNGSRWGVRATVQSQARELTPDEARKRFRDKNESWLREPWDVIAMDHLPSLAEFPLFADYQSWFAAARAFLPRAATPDRIGVREIQPGVWVGFRSEIAPSARLIGPCWIGDNVCVSSNAVIGPMTVLDNLSYIERGAEISESYVGPATLVGAYLALRNSIAWGNTLIDWKTQSQVKVPDAFLLCSLATPSKLPLPHIAKRVSLTLSTLALRGVRLTEHLTRALLLTSTERKPIHE